MDRRLIPALTNWAEMRKNFRWNLPKRFNIAMAVCDDWATLDPDRVAVTHICDDTRSVDWTYGQLKDASDRFATVLAARGVGRGDRVAILLPQHPAVLIAHFAAMKLGAISLPIFTAFGTDALSYRLADSGAVAVVTETAQLEKLAAISAEVPDLRSIYSIDGGVLDFWGAIQNAQGRTPMATTLADDPAMMIYTSGTTGPPKGVLHAHRFLLGHLPSIETSFEGLPHPQDKGWTPADWAWIGGLMDLCLPCLYFGVPIISHRMVRFDPHEAFTLIDRFGVKNAFIPPTALKVMRAAVGTVRAPMRSIISGGESLSDDLMEWGEAVFGASINEIYGQTECNLITAHTGNTMARRSGTLGKPVPGFEVALLDAEGAPVKAGDLGEIAIKTPHPVAFLGYWNKPEETASKYSGDWLLTGDLATQDADGYITYHGRADDVITSAGYRIGPTEIENCLTEHPAVVLAAVVGAPDSIRGEVVHAFVTLKGTVPDTLEADLIEAVRTKVSPHVAPRKVTVISQMPVTTTGKIMRRELRRLYLSK